MIFHIRKGGVRMRALTEKQRQIYDFIVDFQQDHGYPPPPSGRSADIWGSSLPPPSTST